MSRSITAPILYRQFNCLCGECPDNCCTQGWNITYTKAEADRLCKKLNLPEAELFSGDNYKTIKLDKNSACPLLTNDGLCTVHKNHGAQYLSYTCRQYPRIARDFGGTVLCSLRPTCYAVMDRLLSDSGCMRQITEETAAPLEAILTEKEEAKSRFRLFSGLHVILRNNATAQGALHEISQKYSADIGDIRQKFEERYGFPIITADTEKAPLFAQKNLLFSMLYEWTVTSRNISVSDFVFKAGAALLALDGAYQHCGGRTELICSITDFLSLLPEIHANS